MATHIVLLIIILGVGAVTYWFWIRPILKVTPQFKEFYDEEESFWLALRMKLGGIKQKLTTAVVTAAGSIIMLYDFVSPLIASSGVDIHEIGIAKKVPPDLWPIITIGIVLLLGFFRHLSDKRQAEVIQTIEETGKLPPEPPPIKEG